MEPDSLVTALGALATANTAEAKPEFVGPTAKPGIKDPELAARGDADATHHCRIRPERILHRHGPQAAKASTYAAQVRDMIEASHAYYALP